MVRLAGYSEPRSPSARTLRRGRHRLRHPARTSSARPFDRYGQARCGAKQRSTGLGLAISKGIVEARGGSIRVESVEGSGSTVPFVAPAARS